MEKVMLNNSIVYTKYIGLETYFGNLLWRIPDSSVSLYKLLDQCECTELKKCGIDGNTTWWKQRSKKLESHFIN